MKFHKHAAIGAWLFERLPLAVIAATLAVALPPARSAPAVPNVVSPPTERIVGNAGYATQWAGYAVGGSHGMFTNVSATFQVPSVTCAPTETSQGVLWTGIDGYGTSTVQQDGIEVSCSYGNPQFSAWYEIYPAYNMEYFKPAPTIRAGDSVIATVTSEGGSAYKFVVDDLSDSQSGSIIQTDPPTAPPASNSTAECIAEDPADLAGNPVPYSTYSPADLTNCSADDQPLGDFGPDILTMTSDGNAPGIAPDHSVIEASPSSLGPNSAFTVTRLPALPGQSVLATGSDGTTWEKYWQGSASNTDWSYWDSARGAPPGISLGDIAVGLNQVGNPNLFATGSDGNVWQDYWTGSRWSGWGPLGNGGVALHGLAIGRNQFNTPNLFATGSDGNVWQDYWTGSAWSGWYSMGNGGPGLTGGLAVGPNQFGNANVFAIGADGQVWQDFWTGSGWFGWLPMGHGGVTLTGGIADGRNQFNNPNLFATGSDGQVWQDFWTGSYWSGWRQMGNGGAGLKQVTVQRNVFGRNNLFATGSDGQVWQDFWTGGYWFGWMPLGSGRQTASLATGIAAPEPWGT